jgi:hypothetical protein
MYGMDTYLFSHPHQSIYNTNHSGTKGTAVPMNFNSPDDGRVGRKM